MHSLLLEPLQQTTDHPYIDRTFGEALRVVGRMEEARVALRRGRDALPIRWPDTRLAERAAHVRGYASYDLAKSRLGANNVRWIPSDTTRSQRRRIRRHRPSDHR